MKGAARIARAGLFALSAFGLIASVGVYASSFVGKHLEDMPRLFVLLSVGIFVTAAPFLVIEQRVMRYGGIFAVFPERYRSLLKRSFLLSFGFFLIHFILLLVLTGGRSPAIENGEYILSDHGSNVLVVSKQKYDGLKELELRFFAAGWANFYLIGSAYWLFSRQRYLVLDQDRPAPGHS
jgi:hypothetical protein